MTSTSCSLQGKDDFQLARFAVMVGKNYFQLQLYIRRDRRMIIEWKDEADDFQLQLDSSLDMMVSERQLP